MRNVLLLLLIGVWSAMFTAQAQCSKKQKSCSKATSCSKTTTCCKSGKLLLNTKNDTILYIIGADIGTNLKMSFDSVNMGVLVKAMKLGIDGQDTLLTEGEKQSVMMSFQRDLRMREEEDRMKDADVNMAKATTFLAENKKKKGVVETESGLQYKVISEGNGTSPLASDKVTVHYHGTLTDGTIFDSSYDRGQPATFPLNGVIPGWTEGVQLMKEGSVYEFYIKPELGYGANRSGKIPPNSVLIFKVELLTVVIE